MSRYRNAYRDELDEEIVEPEAETPEVVNDNPEEASFKKRYGDLRKHSQKEIDAREKEINDLKLQLANASKQERKMPKTEEEVKQWLHNFPDVGKIVQTLILKELDERDGQYKPQFDEVKELREQIERQKIERQKEIAIGEILEVHPDFLKLIDDTTPLGQKFHAWVANQSRWVQEALYENETDSGPAIDAVDLYKKRNSGGEKETARSAASNVRKGSSPAPKESGNFRFSDSMIAKMSDREYEARYEEIEEARRKGEYDYDGE